MALVVTHEPQLSGKRFIRVCHVGYHSYFNFPLKRGLLGSVQLRDFMKTTALFMCADARLKTSSEKYASGKDRQVRRAQTLVLGVRVAIKPMVHAPLSSPCLHHLFPAFLIGADVCTVC